MFAVFKSGNAQYKVQEKDELKIEKIEGEAGSKVNFDEILLLGSDKKTCLVGTPFVKGAVIEAEIISTHKDDKVLVFKRKRRKNYRRMHGHRQEVTHIKINKITKN